MSTMQSLLAKYHLTTKGKSPLTTVKTYELTNKSACLEGDESFLKKSPAQLTFNVGFV